MADRAQEQGLYTKLHLRVTARTSLGQTVCVSGSSSAHFALGSDARGEALEMVTTPSEWPVWRTKKPIIIARHALHEYAYSLKCGGEVESETGLDFSRTRSVTATDAEVTVDDVFGRFHLDEGARSASMSSTAQGDAQPPNRRLVVVCYHLPVRVSKDGRGNWTASWGESLIARSPEGSYADDHACLWLGTVFGGLDRRKLSDEDQRAIAAVLAPMNCVPVFSAHSKDAYLKYCKQVLWPSFHNVTVLDQTCACWQDGADPSRAWDQEFADHWDDYERLNEDFRDSLLAILREGDTIWVHDYHLMLLPSLLAENNHPMFRADMFTKRKARIVFFLHIPFPTSQLFCSLAHGAKLLEGVVGADVVGFHAFDHARHFLNACKRLMGMPHKSVQGGVTGVEHKGRTVMVVVRHVSVEPPKLSAAMASPATDDEAAALDAALARPGGGGGAGEPPKLLVFAGVEACQRLSGVALKLLAFERFLSEYPRWRGKCALVQYVTLDGTRDEDERRTSGELQTLVRRINAQCPGSLVYREFPASRVTLNKRVALWKRADVLVGTALREGHNLLPFEYAYAREGNPGVTLASEFSSAASLLSGALSINPFDVASVAVALDAALSMSPSERRDRLARDLPYVKSRPSGQWTREILHDMNLVHKQKRIYGEDREMVVALDVGACAAAYRRATKRVLLLDLGGTLVPKGDYITKVLKKQQVTASGGSEDLIGPRAGAALEKLSGDPNTLVYVVTGATMHALHALLGKYPRVGLAAANGLCTTGPCSSYDASRCCGVADLGQDWDAIRKIAGPVLARFAARTNGACVLARDPGLAWSYYRSDPEWGRVMAGQLIAALESLLAAYDVGVVHLDGMIEIVPGRMHKGNVVKHILAASSSDPDFVFCCGDSANDEKMFSSLYSHLADATALPDARCFTVTVGKKASRALFYVEDEARVADALTALAAAV